ncbi:hypothetical protein MMC10_005789 [Thelotrema lepadinum]|nr:hypothetical protein [Thelotrema lepadinum]
MGMPPVPTGAPSSSSASSAPQSASQSGKQSTRTPSKSISNRAQWTPKEMRSFSYGLHKTLPNFSTYFESDFWNKQIPRLAHTDSAVRHALNALATFHEKSHQHDAAIEGKGKEADSELIPGSLNKFFLQQYNKSISELSQKISGNDHQAVISTLVCCCIFMAIEGLHGRHLAMVNHITNGLKVYHEWIRHVPPIEQFSATSIEASVYVQFKRIDYHAATFVDNHVPEPRSLNIIGLPPPVDDFNPNFLSIEHARAHVDSLMGRSFMFLRAYEGTKFEGLELEKIPQDIKDKHRTVGIWLHTTAIALDQFTRDANLDEFNIGTRGLTLLKVRIKVLTVFHRRWPHERAPNEECELDFHSIVAGCKALLMGHIKALLTPDDSEQSASSPDDGSEGSSYNASTTPPTLAPFRFEDPPIFTLETGITPILYYVAVTTLSHPLRLEAISLLRTANLREGLWSSNRTADMAETRIANHNGQTCPMTGSDMSELTKKLWAELRLEESLEGWGFE